MKIQSKLALMASLAALATSPSAFAGKDAPAVEPAAPAVTEAAESPVVIEEPAAETDVPADAGGDVVDTGDKGTEVELSDPTAEITGSGKDDGAMPIDWVKRGDGVNPDVIFQNTAVGEAPVFKGSTARELGQDDKAAAIDNKSAGAAPMKGEKKEPVALIKKGRVFLR